MKKYLIIDTWNGEGYTDSNVTLMEFKSVMAVERYCKEMAQHQINAWYGDDEYGKDKVAERFEEQGANEFADKTFVAYGYEMGDDAGAYH